MASAELAVSVKGFLSTGSTSSAREDGTAPGSRVDEHQVRDGSEKTCRRRIPGGYLSQAASEAPDQLVIVSPVRRHGRREDRRSDVKKASK